MLTTDLDGDDEKDKGALDNLLSQLIAELCMDKKVSCGMSTHASICSFWTQLLPMEELTAQESQKHIAVWMCPRSLFVLAHFA